MTGACVLLVVAAILLAGAVVWMTAIGDRLRADEARDQAARNREAEGFGGHVQRGGVHAQRGRTMEDQHHG